MNISKELIEIAKRIDFILHKREEIVKKSDEIKQKWLLTDYLIDIRMSSNGKLGELFAEKGHLLDELDECTKQNQKLAEELEELRRRVERLKEEGS